MIELNEQQIERLYDIYDFETYEHITKAVLTETELRIYYITDVDDEYMETRYIPELIWSNKEDIDKLRYILTGGTDNDNITIDSNEKWQNK